MISDGVVPHDERQFQSLWFLRKGVASAAAELGHVFKSNSAVRAVEDYYDVVEATKEAIQKTDQLSNKEKQLVSTYGFGHMADGDIHINICVEGHENRELS